VLTRCIQNTNNFEPFFKTIIVNFAGLFLHWMDESECMNCRAVLGMFLAIHRCAICRGWVETDLFRRYNSSMSKNLFFGIISIIIVGGCQTPWLALPVTSPAHRIPAKSPLYYSKGACQAPDRLSVGFRRTRSIKRAPFLPSRIWGKNSTSTTNKSSSKDPNKSCLCRS